MNTSNNTSGTAALERFLQQFASDTNTSRARLVLGWRYAKNRQTTAARICFSQCQLDTSPTLSALALLAEANVHYKSGDQVRALQSFSSVAAATSAPLGIRREALRRAAAIIHSLHDPALSWLAFDAAARIAATPAQAAEARLEQAGLAYEMALCQKGRIADARQLCDNLLAQPALPTDIAARAALMRAEAMQIDGDNDAALQAYDTIISQYSGISYVQNTALAYRGVALYRLHRLADAKDQFQQILARTITPSDFFPGNHPKAHALNWLGWIAAEEGRTADRDAYFQALQTQFPNSENTRYLNRLLNAASATTSTAALP